MNTLNGHHGAAMDDTIDLEVLRRRVEAIGTLGAPVGALLERLDQAAPDDGPVLLEELESVVQAVERVTAAVRDALAGAPEDDSVAAATAVAAAPPADAALDAMVKQQVDKTLQAVYASWREDILARTIAEVSTRTAKGISDLLRSRAFLDRIMPQVVSKAEEAARRSVGELGLALRQQVHEQISEAKGSGGKGTGASAAEVVDEVLKRLNDSGVLDRAPAAGGASLNLEDILDSQAFKTALEDRLHHIVTYIKNDVVPSELKKLTAT